MKAQKTNTKHNQVREHLKTKRTITSLEAIKLFSATRLSAIIFTLRKKEHWDITMTPIHIKDRNGNDCIYGLYTLVATPEESVLQKKFEKAIMPSGAKTQKKK
jgi:hypothetical protein